MSDNEKQRGTALRRQEILAAARKLFSRQGYEKTTMQQVVKEAGTSIGNCYFYFSNKGSLLQALVEDIILEIKDEAEAAVVTLPDDAVTRLTISVYILISKILENSEISRIILLGLAQPALRESTFNYYTAALKRFLEEHPNLLSDRHGLESIDTELMIETWMGGCAAALEAAVTGEVQRDAHQICRFLIAWNLRAAGVTDHEISIGLAELEKFTGDRKN